ncbi:MAG TPA: hypothetical protein PLZ93_15015 [Nocardioides sp.]|nr:hypothetical protein [Nocardioides sp.]
MTTTRVYRSTDTSAPTLTGEVGSLSSLLKTVLVGTSGVAYGTGADEKTAAGWTKPYDTGNKVVLRNSLAEGGVGCYLRCDDGAIGTGGARDGMCRVYGSMSDVDTGTDYLPPVGSYANGGVIRKSTTANSTARPWIIVADELTCYVQTEWTSGVFALYGFGDFASEIIGDAYRYFGFFGPNENSGACAIAIGGATSFASPSESNKRGGFVGRRYQQDTGPQACSVYGLACNTPTGNGTASSGLTCIGGSLMPLTDPSAGGAHRYYAPALLVEGGTIRGLMRGLYASPTNMVSTVSNATTDVSVPGLPSGSEVLLLISNVSGAVDSARTGVVAIETALPWS